MDRWGDSGQGIFMVTPTLCLIDLQPRLIAAVPEGELLLERAVFLCRVSMLFRVPVLATEQVPTKLGGMADALVDELPDGFTPFVKERFSAFNVLKPHLPPHVEVLLAGVETHICVRQTALDLRSAGYKVTLVLDAMGSRMRGDANIAEEELRRLSVGVVSAEALAYHWCGTSVHPQFKALNALVHDRPDEVPF